MSLREKRIRFTRNLGRLLLYAELAGICVAVDEVKRSKAQAQANAAAGVGIKDSLHVLGLAVDLDLYESNGRWMDGKLPIDRDTYKKLADYWLTLDPDNAWGGSWGDLRHYSLSHGGVR